MSNCPDCGEPCALVEVKIEPRWSEWKEGHAIAHNNETIQVKTDTAGEIVAWRLQLKPVSKFFGLLCRSCRMIWSPSGRRRVHRPEVLDMSLKENFWTRYIISIENDYPGESRKVLEELPIWKDIESKGKKFKVVDDLVFSSLLDAYFRDLVDYIREHST